MNHSIAEIKVSYKPNYLAPSKFITSSNDAFKILFSSWDHDLISFIEEFKFILLDRKNQVLGVCQAFRGSGVACIVDVKYILATALKANAKAIILAHNHPSGNLKASNEDILLTKKIKEACDLLDLKILDHLIITDNYYTSFADEFLMPF